EPGIDDLDGGYDALHRPGHFVDAKSGSTRRKIPGHTEPKLGFHHAHEESARVQANAAVMAQRGEQTPGEWLLDIELALGDFIRAGNLVADCSSAVALHQSLNNAAFAIVRVLLGSRSHLTGTMP